jgi:SAM-dependent methyltransferase
MKRIASRLPAQCPACESQQINRLWIKLQAPTNLHECGECGLVFCFPQPAVGSLSAGPQSVLTDEEYTKGMIGAPTRARYVRLAEGRYEQYKVTLGRDRFRLLEIGCGLGSLGTTFQRLGVDYWGIDIDPRVINTAKDLGISNVSRIDIFDLPDTVRYDAISFSQVLEHIKLPDHFLRKVYSLLVPNGIVHCDVPNHYSLPALLYRLPISSARYGAITYPHHLFAYSKKTLYTLFDKLFTVKVFDATVDDPTWGQAITDNNPLAKYSSFLKLLHAGSLLVAYGVKRSDQLKVPGHATMPEFGVDENHCEAKSR